MHQKNGSKKATLRVKRVAEASAEMKALRQRELLLKLHASRGGADDGHVAVVGPLLVGAGRQ